jgi:amino acid adenylation domain-containing protein
MTSDLYVKLKELKIKLRVVDDNLDIQAPNGVLTSELLDEIRFHQTGLIQLINSYKSPKGGNTSIPATAEASDYPASLSQQISGEGEALPPLPTQYRDYAAWQQEHLSGSRLKEHEDYWMNELSGELPVLNLPVDKPRPVEKSCNGATVSRPLSNALSTRLRVFSQEQGATLFMGLLAAVTALLHRYTTQEDIIISTPLPGRDPAGLDDQIDLYVNTIPLRTRFSGEDSYRELLDNVRQVTLEAFGHQAYPFDELTALLETQRDVSRNTLFDVGILLQKTAADLNDEPPGATGMQVSSFESAGHQIALFDLIFIFVERGDSLSISIQYNSDIYEHATIERMCGHLALLLNGVADDPARPINRIDFLEQEEKEKLLYTFGNMAADQSAVQTAVELFEEQVLKTPGSSALRFYNTELTYEELNGRANRLGDYLVKKYGVSPGELVAIKLERSEWTVIAILGILKSGAAYLPIDPEYPEDRVAYMLSDSKCRLLIDAAELASFSENELLYSPENPVMTHDPSGLAYVIYTSGSTGNPKGTEITHGSLGCFLSHVRSSYVLATPVVMPFIASYSFDISIFHLFMPLITGGTSVIVSKQQFQDISQFAGLLAQANFIDAVPAVHNMLCNYILENDMAGGFRQVEKIFIGGDSITDSLLHKLATAFPAATVIVTYGPTEATIFCTHLAHAPGTIREQARGAVIGRPISRAGIYILDKQQELCPLGVTGEICIGGPGLAKGYLNNQELTDAKFIRHPFRQGERIYRSGDLGRWLPDGTIEFAGRNDAQVKIRGFRIEPGEIEKALEQYEDVSSSVVLSKPGDGSNYLVAYVERKKRVKLTPSTSEFFVYDGLLYYALTTNEKRNGHYRRVFNKLLKDKVVLDLGTGADVILSRFCVEAGARKVYAVEILEETYEAARKCISELGLEDKITLIHGDITKIELPEKVDYCVSEIVGSIGGSEGAAKLINATRRFLKDPSNMLPKRSLTKIAAVTLPDELHGFSFDEVGQHYTKRIFDQVGYRFDIRLCVEDFPKENVLTNHEPFEDLDFTNPIKLEDKHNIRLEFTRDSIVHGFIVWLNLYIDEEELIDSLSERYNWVPIYLPVFYNDTRVSRGDYIEGSIERLLSDNGLNPDFIIRGTLVRQNDVSIEFTYKTSNHEKQYRSNPFYQKLFENDTVRLKEDLSEDVLRAHLKASLPEYMVPSHFVILDKLPLTPNGKIDRKLLPDPRAAGNRAVAFEEARNETERNLVAVFEEVLKKKPVSIHDDFFDLGGDSIKSIQMASCLKQKGLMLAIQEVYFHPTIARLATQIKACVS